MNTGYFARVGDAWVNVQHLLAVQPYDNNHPGIPRAILVMLGNVTIYVNVSVADAMTQLAEGFKPGRPVPIDREVPVG